MQTGRTAVVLSLLWLAPEAQAADGDVTVTTRVYTINRVEPDLTGGALDVAAHTFGMASIAVRWIRCDRAPQSCSERPAPGELLLRLAAGRSPHAGSGRVVALGDAFVVAGRRDGVLATIYVDRVERLAADSATDMRVLMGRAIAHELGHLVLATASHAPNGLMRSHWSAADLRRNDPADWAFSRTDAAAMLRRLTSPGDLISRSAPPRRARR